MFTGLIESTALIVENQALQSGRRLVINAVFDAIQSGESIAVNGVCLTALPDQRLEYLAFDLSPETLTMTTLGDLVPGQSVNLERSLLASSRMGGHYVSGHVDTTANVQWLRPVGDFVELAIGDFGVDATRFLIPKGSITLDGVSLTINEVGDSVTVMLIPHTLAMTTFKKLNVGQRVNVEFDYLARIIAHQLASSMPRAGII